MAKIFDKVYEKIHKNKRMKEEGKVNTIPPPFPRLAKRYPGWERGKYTIITASSGIGKTKITKFLTITSIQRFKELHPNVPVKVFYFALEESEDEFWLGFVSTMLYEKYDITISTPELKSLGQFTVSDDLMTKIQDCRDYIDEISNYVEVIDHTSNAFGIYKHVREWHDDHGTYITNEHGHKIGYTPNDPDQWVFVITDHISLLSTDKDKTHHSTISYFSQEFCLKQMCKRLNCVVINVQQQAAEKERLEFNFKGGTIEQKLEPSLDGLADNKTTQRDADLVFGLFAPDRYNLEKHRGYNILKLKDNYRSLVFLKDRHYGLANSYIPLYFNGASNIFEELPKCEEMDYSKYQRKTN